MKTLIPVNQFGIFADKDEVPRISSLAVAKLLEKRHDNVLRDIERITHLNVEVSENYMSDNFKLDAYKDVTGRKLKCYQLSEKALSLLLSSYVGEKYMIFRIQYIERFEEMKSQIRNLLNARADFPRLTDMIKLLYNSPKFYTYVNECNMINRVGIGMTAAQFKKVHELGDVPSIRPYLTHREIAIINDLQSVDIGLLYAVPHIKDREKILREHKSKLDSGKLRLLM